MSGLQIQLSKMEKVTSKGVTGLHVLYGSAIFILVGSPYTVDHAMNHPVPKSLVSFNFYTPQACTLI